MESNEQNKINEKVPVCPVCGRELIAPYRACPYCGFRIQAPIEGNPATNTAADGASGDKTKVQAAGADNAPGDKMNAQSAGADSAPGAKATAAPNAEEAAATGKAENFPESGSKETVLNGETFGTAENGVLQNAAPPMTTAVLQKTCPVCATVYPATLGYCPKCGYTPYATYAASKKAQKSTVPLYKKWWLWLIIGTVIFAVSILLITLIPKATNTDNSDDKEDQGQERIVSSDWRVLYNKDLEICAKFGSASLFTCDDLTMSFKNRTDKSVRIVPSGGSLNGRAVSLYLSDDDDVGDENHIYFDLAPGEIREMGAGFYSGIDIEDDDDDLFDTGDDDDISHYNIKMEFELYSTGKNELLGTTGQLEIKPSGETEDSLKQFKGKTAFEDDQFLVTSVEYDHKYYLTVKNKTDKALQVNLDKLRLFGYILPTEIVSYDTASVLGGATAVFTIDEKGLPSGELSLRLVYSQQVLPQNAYESSTKSFVCIP